MKFIKYAKSSLIEAEKNVFSFNAKCPLSDDMALSLRNFQGKKIWQLDPSIVKYGLQKKGGYNKLKTIGSHGRRS